jgi:hypothetical protein
VDDHGVLTVEIIVREAEGTDRNERWGGADYSFLPSQNPGGPWRERRQRKKSGRGETGS